MKFLPLEGSCHTERERKQIYPDNRTIQHTRAFRCRWTRLIYNPRCASRYLFGIYANFIVLALCPVSALARNLSLSLFGARIGEWFLKFASRAYHYILIDSTRIECIIDSDLFFRICRMRFVLHQLGRGNRKRHKYRKI